MLDEALQDIDSFVFGESISSTAFGVPTWEMKMQDIINCRNVAIEKCDENLCNVSIPESEGECVVAGPPI